MLQIAVDRRQQIGRKEPAGLEQGRKTTHQDTRIIKTLAA